MALFYFIVLALYVSSLFFYVTSEVVILRILFLHILPQQITQLGSFQLPENEFDLLGNDAGQWDSAHLRHALRLAIGK